jgi:hypothetical protein
MDESDDPEENPLPLSLRVVAYATILFGIGSVIDLVVGLFHGKVSINFGVLQIPAGFGLLRLSRGWRTFVLVCLWFAFIVAGIMIVAFAFGAPIKYTGVLPRPLTAYGRELALTYCAVMLGYMIWEYRVLTSPRIKRLFGL